MVNLRDGSVTAASGVQESEIEQQVARLLSDNHFRNSKRLPSFLRFVVGETVQGRGDSLKERTIGAAVFARPIGYDTAGDPIVRVAAADSVRGWLSIIRIPDMNRKLGSASLPALTFLVLNTVPPLLHRKMKSMSTLPKRVSRLGIPIHVPRIQATLIRRPQQIRALSAPCRF